MVEWRFLRGWTDDELSERLKGLDELSSNFDLDDASMTEDRGWRRQHSEAIIAVEEPGLPAEESIFSRLCLALENYEFSDPSIVTAHFHPDDPLEGKRMLLEIKVLGLRYLTGTIVSLVRDDDIDGEHNFGFRYETLEGHLESGWEWFLIRKEHATGNIRFSITARWKEGEFPNFWSHLGFHLLARRMQKKWHRRAHRRMSLLSRYPLEALDHRGRAISHEGPKILFDFR